MRQLEAVFTQKQNDTRNIKNNYDQDTGKNLGPGERANIFSYVIRYVKYM